MSCAMAVHEHDVCELVDFAHRVAVHAARRNDDDYLSIANEVLAELLADPPAGVSLKAAITVKVKQAVWRHLKREASRRETSLAQLCDGDLQGRDRLDCLAFREEHSRNLADDFDIRDLVEKLPERVQPLAELRFVHLHSCSEIAEITRVSRQEIHRRCKRICKQMKDLYLSSQ